MMTTEEKDKQEPRVVVPVRMRAAARDAIDKAAIELGLVGGRSEFIREACAEKLARHNQSKKNQRTT